jgi:hypothetical protein
MTVVRERAQFLEASVDSASDAVKEVASEERAYMSIVSLPSGNAWEMVIRPNWWTIPTRMNVEVQEANGRSKIIVSTRSQWFIIADLFGFYVGYIDRFIAAVEARISPAI